MLFLFASTSLNHYECSNLFMIFCSCRLLTGSILAHEMMHAWLRLKGEGKLAFIWQLCLHILST